MLGPTSWQVKPTPRINGVDVERRRALVFARPRASPADAPLSVSRFAGGARRRDAVGEGRVAIE